jgi:hypothetical protein
MLFMQMLKGQAATPDAQDAFHRHAWPDQLHLSVCMSRADARTVSRTCVELDSQSARMTYTTLNDGGSHRTVSVALQPRVLQPT